MPLSYFSRDILVYNYIINKLIPIMISILLKELYKLPEKIEDSVYKSFILSVYR